MSSTRTSSILDVARKANVAPSTVSLVVNRHPRVSAETRKRVESVIKQMGYKPRSARRKKRHVAVLYTRNMLVSGELIEYCREWIAGIREGLGEDGADVSVFTGQSHVHDDPMFTTNLDNADFDGLIMMGVNPKDGYLDTALQHDAPIVVMERKPKQAEFSAVHLDYHTAGQIAADHLLELGHTRIGLCIPDTEDFPAAALRAGFQSKLRENNLEIAPVAPASTIAYDDLAGFTTFAQQVVDSGITAIFCGEHMAYRLANALHAMHVSVPEQISILGIDDLGMETDAGSKLSSVGYDKQMMGRLAGQLLQTLIAAEGSVTHMTASIPPQLAPGQTTGPAPT